MANTVQQVSTGPLNISYFFWRHPLPMDNAPTAGSSPFSRWQVLYGVAAVMVLLIVGLDQYLGMRMADRFAQSIETDREWAERFSALGELRKLATDTNAPANDIFATGDVAIERSRLRRSAIAFDQRMVQVREMFTNHPVDTERELILRG